MNGDASDVTTNATDSEIGAGIGNAIVAVVVVAQNAELAHGSAWLSGSTPRPAGDGISCSQFAGVLR